MASNSGLTTQSGESYPPLSPEDQEHVIGEWKRLRSLPDGRTQPAGGQQGQTGNQPQQQQGQTGNQRESLRGALARHRDRRQQQQQPASPDTKTL